MILMCPPGKCGTLAVFNVYERITIVSIIYSLMLL